MNDGVRDEETARHWLRSLIEVDAEAWERLTHLVDLLTVENARQNLVSTGSLGEVWRRHIADSAQLLRFVPRETSELGPWLDLGTGAGFPGLVVAALRPETPVWLIESRARRAEWLRRACTALGLEHAKVIETRLEQVPAVRACVISARAFAPLDRLVALSARFSTKHTLWLLPKGRSAAQELHMLSGWRHVFHVEPSLTDAESGIVIGELLGPADIAAGGKERRKHKVKR